MLPDDAYSHTVLFRRAVRALRSPLVGYIEPFGRDAMSLEPGRHSLGTLARQVHIALCRTCLRVCIAGDRYLHLLMRLSERDYLLQFLLFTLPDSIFPYREKDVTLLLLEIR